MKITFVLADHFPDDERVWYQQAASLKVRGHEVFVVSSKLEKCDLKNVFCFNDDGLSKKRVIGNLANILLEIKPDMLICDHPISVFAARKYNLLTTNRTPIVYDVTEWYPSRTNLQNRFFFRKMIKFIALLSLSFFAGCTTNKFIFGEYHKGIFFRILFPFKKYIYLPYFATVEDVKQYPVQNIADRCELFYSGKLSKASGFDKVLEVAVKCAKKMANTEFVLKVVSNQEFEIDKWSHIQNLKIILMKKIPYHDFCEEIGKSDIFMDLRKIDFVNNYSLPIKIFYYLAAGRPVIYSESKAIKNFFSKNEIENFGLLTDPNPIDKIVDTIAFFVHNRDYYYQCCTFSYEIAKNKYHWNIIKNKFTDFIENNAA